jgi:hypothetical protein
MRNVTIERLVRFCMLRVSLLGLCVGDLGQAIEVHVTERLRSRDFARAPGGRPIRCRSAGQIGFVPAQLDAGEAEGSRAANHPRSEAFSELPALFSTIHSLFFSSFRKTNPTRIFAQPIHVESVLSFSVGFVW